MAVKIFKHSDSGAPTLTGEVGSLVNLLKKCLVDGYGSKTPLGWGSFFNGAYTKGAFQNIAADGATGMWLFVDDTGVTPAGAKSSKWLGYETITGLDGSGEPTGPGIAFPTIASGSYVMAQKSSTADATARRWKLIGDSKRFWLLRAWSAAGLDVYDISFFGDFLPMSNVDTHRCAIIGQSSEYVSGTPSHPAGYSAAQNLSSALTALQGGHWVARHYNQANGAQQFGKGGDLVGSIGYAGYTYPNPVDGSMIVCPISILENSGLRGFLPGVYQPVHARPTDHGVELSNIAGMEGRTLLMVAISAINSVANPITDNATGRLAVDITGPWE